MKCLLWKNIKVFAGGLAATVLLTATATAQETVEQRQLRELQQQVQQLARQYEANQKQTEALRQQNDVLLKTLNSAPQQPVSTQAAPVLNKQDVQQMISSYMQEQGERVKIAGPKVHNDGWYEVGSDLRLSASWREGLQFATRNNDFKIHVGGWIQEDAVFWGQSSQLRAAPTTRPGAAQGVASGALGGGIGELQDGTSFRRLHFLLEGTVWENYEFMFVHDFANDQFNTTGLDEFWVGAKDVPFLGTIRIGHVKNAMGLEADMVSSSRAMTFMERSSYSEAIFRNENLVTGLLLSNNYFDQRVTSTFVAFRTDPGSSTGSFYGDGQWGWQGRLTALPIYENKGRHLMHVGLSGGWRNGASNSAVSPLRTRQLGARSELRGDNPAGTFNGAVGANGNSNRMIDTGVAVGERDWLMGLELLYICGPFSLQAEYGANVMEGVRGFAPVGNTLTPALASAQNYMFHGGYVQLAYTLTGEHRHYDKRLGCLDTYYFGREGPYTNAWFVRGEDGALDAGWGAWEIAARYSYTNLNDGTGTNRIQGGVMEGLTLGLNWYLNTNLKFQFDYVYNHRYDMASNAASGATNGFGTRLQFMY